MKENINEDVFEKYVNQITEIAMTKPKDELTEFVRDLVGYVSELEALVLTFDEWEVPDLNEYKQKIRTKLATFGITVKEEPCN